MSQELARFRVAKEREIVTLKRFPPSAEALATALSQKRPNFLGALKTAFENKGFGLIAEYKRASPSLGDIDLELTPQAAVEAYSAADVISVLTEETYFKGSLAFLTDLAKSHKPLLRKDFIFDPLQIAATALTPAAAVLLIVRLTPEPKLLAELIKNSLALKIEPVVEVYDSRDLELAREGGARVILVNSRDLETLKVDLAGPVNLIKKSPPRPEEFWIAASGLKTTADLARVKEAGFGAALLGSSLMASANPKKTLNSLLEELGRLN
ncbi:MAG: indole-3-glycerol-phosphate synthase [Deltaproteobacteria bacterium]|nr:indole-3-glycerol-phosphate synthase [Deltaproteobacteria bacterium]